MGGQQHGGTPPPWISRDGQFYWDGARWVAFPRRARGSSPLATAALAVLLLLGGLWVLNNTRFGVQLKCNLLGDQWACLLLAADQLTSGLPPSFVDPAPPVPVVTESPQERARREEERRAVAISNASSAIRTAIDDLNWNAHELATAAGDMSTSADDVDAALPDMEKSYDSLKAETKVRPMDSFQRDEVCFALDAVSFARDDIDFEVDDFEFETDDYLQAATARPSYVSTLRLAVERLRTSTGTEVARWQAVLDEAEFAEGSSTETAATASSTANAAKTRVEESSAAADVLMSDAKSLAATVAEC